MQGADNLGSFIIENSRLAKEWAETRIELYKLEATRVASKIASGLVLVAVGLFMSFLVLTFLGVTVGFWFSSVTGNYATGFGITTVLLLFLLVMLALLLRKPVMNAMIRSIIRAGQGNKLSAKEK